jgi:hypothetical protein
MRILLWLIMAGVLTVNVHAGLFVAPDGSDTNPGTREKPLGTLARARDAMRGVADDRRIVMRGGSYFDMNLELGPEDSGLTIEAAPGEKPLLYGGVLLSGWEKDGDKFVSAPLPPGSEKAEVRMLEVGGRMAPRARYPATGTLMHESVFDVRWMSSTGDGWQRKPTREELTTLRYKAGDLDDWLNLKNAEITVYHMWDESCVGLAAHDAVARTLTFSSAAGHPPGAFGVKKYVLWNIREGLTAPGQWFHDRSRGRIVYWPLAGLDMAKTPVVAATRETIVRLCGTDKQPLQNVTLRGLSLSATTVPLRAAGFASSAFNGAVSIENTVSCTLDNLTVARVAGHGVNTRRTSRGLKVRGCEIVECGAGGIYAGGDGTLIENNHIHQIGLGYPSAIGIYRGGKNSIVRHNEVHDTSYSAINYGGENNVVENNLIYNCMKTLHDGAAIYLFAAKNCIIRGNVERDIVDGGGYGASAYYLDERSEGCVVENNLALRVNWIFHNHMALNNTIRNNVAVIEGDARISFPKSSNYTIEGNVVYATGRIRIENDAAVTAWKHNLLYSGTGKVERAALNNYSQSALATGAPEGTSTDDPLFVNLKEGDYNYRLGSPATALGLKPIDPRRAGRQ